MAATSRHNPLYMVVVRPSGALPKAVTTEPEGVGPAVIAGPHRGASYALP
jgi:hypothetical protein